MNAKLIFLIGAAGSGKSTIGRWVASELDYCYLDKDVICNTFTGALLSAHGYSPYERDGCPYYKEVVLELEYRTLLNIANDNLQLGRSVVLDAPFLSYFSQSDYVLRLQKQFGWQYVTPHVLAVSVEPHLLKMRLQTRGLERDAWKLANWEEYWRHVENNGCRWTGVPITRYDNSAVTVDAAALRAALA